MASTSSSTAVAAMAQRASDQYLTCRRNVTAKVDEVKLLDEQISAAFQQITALSEAPEGQEELSEEAKAAIKSVGRLEVTLAGVEGEEPVPNAMITVSLDPEYDADEYETVEEVVEKKDVVVTDEHGNVVEDGQVSEKDDEGSPRKLKTTTKITRTIIKKRVKKEKTPVVRTIPWTSGTKSQEDMDKTEMLTFPVTFVFDPVQSREAVVIVTVAAADEDEDETEPVKEIEFTVSSLFHNNTLDRWYSAADEEEEEELTSITEIVEKAVKATIKEEVAAEETEQVEETDVKKIQDAEDADTLAKVEKTDETGKNEEPNSTADSDNTEKDGNTEEAVKTVDTEKNEEAAKTEDNEKSEDGEKIEEAAKTEDSEKTEEGEKHETMDEVKQVEDTAKVESAGEVEENKPTGSRFHVKANFVMSEAEKLSISVVALSKKKQEAEAALLVLEREAASLRTKYDRLNASQRQLSASSISKPKTNLLGGRFGVSSVPMQRKSWYQSSRERTNAFITKHQHLLISVAMFTGSVCLFHFNGENLLA
ncbi:unnamed protein product [Peronospora belbahrii]|uniref:Uncharacterized protein n=1 Tax=Peronospora belbahrii TaxID=622444 RepID=A0AAU9LBY0_9STRA|nr:unnamed protein product [Peronospora belbahrii]CAH0521021.1 unnamed protein product [Peronospora belbahrii]